MDIEFMVSTGGTLFSACIVLGHYNVRLIQQVQDFFILAV